MRYRVVKPAGKYRIGQIVEMGRTGMNAVAGQVGQPTHAWCIPEEMGQHYSEREPVTLREFEDDRVPLELEAVDTDLEKALEASRERFTEISAGVTELRQNTEAMCHRLSIIGATAQEAADIAEAIEKLEKLEDQRDELEGKLLVLQRKMGRQRPQLGIDGRRERLKELAIILAQYSDLLDQVDLQPEQWGATLWTHGPEAHGHFVQFMELAAEYSGVEKERIGVALRTRPDLVQLITWARETVS